MTYFRIFGPPLLSLSAAALLPAQSPSVQYAIPRTPIHAADSDPVGGAYGTWAAGTSYKVEFLPDGARFVPYLGMKEPVNRSWRWETTSIQIGERETVAPGTAPRATHSDYRYELHWPNAVERYDVLDEGLEQSFVLADRPATPGDWIVTGRVESDLVAQDAAPGHRPLTFHDGRGRAVVEYGRAFAIDADGVVTRLNTEYRSGAIHIRVAADVLASARYPLVIDPLVQSRVIGSGIALATGSDGPDIAHDRDGAQDMVTFVRAASSSDLDLTAVIFPLRLGTGGVTVFSDVTSAWSVRQAAVACASRPRKYVVAFTREFAPQVSGVRFHVHRSGDLIPSTTVYPVSQPAKTYDQRVDVGGSTRTPQGSHAMLVFERRVVSQTAVEGVMALPIDISGSKPAYGLPVAIPSAGGGSGFAFFETGRPAIAKQRDGRFDSWLVVFQERQISGTSGVQDVFYLVGRMVHIDGSSSSGYWTPKDSFPLNTHRFAPRVAGMINTESWSTFAVAFAQEPVSGRVPSGAWGDFVAVEQLTWKEGSPGPNARSSQVDLPTQGAVSSKVGGIAYDKRTRTHWSLTTNTGIYRVGYDGIVEAITPPLQSGHVRYPGGIDYYDAGGYVALLGSAPIFVGSGSVTGYETLNPSPSPWTTAGPGCGPAQIEWTTAFGSRGPRYDQQIGHRFTEVAVKGTNPGTLHVLLIGTGTANIDLSGTPGIRRGCRLLVPPSGPGFLAAFSQVQAGPDVRWPLPLPAGLPNFTLHAQEWHIPSGTNEFVATERLSVDLAK